MELRNRSRFRRTAEVPTSSMADIAFLLIVFFMLTTVFSANRGIEHILPAKEDVEDPKDEEAIYIQIFPGRTQLPSGRTAKKIMMRVL